MLLKSFMTVLLTLILPWEIIVIYFLKGFLCFDLKPQKAFTEYPFFMIVSVVTYNCLNIPMYSGTVLSTNHLKINSSFV